VKQSVFTQCGTRCRFLTAVASDGAAIHKAAEHLASWRAKDVKRDPDLLIQLCDVEHYSTDDVGLKVFDEARERSSPFMNGNVFSNIQTSTCVRAVADLECNGFEFEPGLLRGADLKWLDMARNRRVPGADVACSWFIEPNDPDTGTGGRDLLRDRATELYCFFHHDGPLPDDRKQVVHGWLLLDAIDHQVLRRLDLDGTPRFSQIIMDRAVEILTQQRSNPVDLVRIDGGVEVFVDPGVEVMARQLLADRGQSIDVARNLVVDVQRHDYPRP